MAVAETVAVTVVAVIVATVEVADIEILVTREILTARTFAKIPSLLPRGRSPWAIFPPFLPLLFRPIR